VTVLAVIAVALTLTAAVLVAGCAWHRIDQLTVDCRRLTRTNHRQARTIDRLARQLDPHRPRRRAGCARKENARGR